jgi:hypothetical protein
VYVPAQFENHTVIEKTNERFAFDLKTIFTEKVAFYGSGNPIPNFQK